MIGSDVGRGLANVREHPKIVTTKEFLLLRRGVTVSSFLKIITHAGGGFKLLAHKVNKDVVSGLRPQLDD